MSTIGVKQGCPLSPTFGLYINEVANYITRRGGEGIGILGTPIHILLYIDDMLLVSMSYATLHHLNALHGFCHEKDLTVNHELPCIHANS